MKTLLKQHQNKFAKRRRNVKLLKTIVLLSLTYFVIFGATALLPTIKIAKASAREWSTEQMDRITCYDLNEYLKIYPNAELNPDNVLACDKWLD